MKAKIVTTLRFKTNEMVKPEWADKIKDAIDSEGISVEGVRAQRDLGLHVTTVDVDIATEIDITIPDALKTYEPIVVYDIGQASKYV